MWGVCQCAGLQRSVGMQWCREGPFVARTSCDGADCRLPMGAPSSREPRKTGSARRRRRRRAPGREDVGVEAGAGPGRPHPAPAAPGALGGARRGQPVRQRLRGGIEGARPDAGPGPQRAQDRARPGRRRGPALRRLAAPAPAAGRRARAAPRLARHAMRHAARLRVARTCESSSQWGRLDSMVSAIHNGRVGGCGGRCGARAGGRRVLDFHPALPVPDLRAEAALVQPLRGLPAPEVPPTTEERACHVVGAGRRAARGGTAAGGGLGDGPAVGRPWPGPTASEAAEAVDSPTDSVRDSLAATVHQEESPS